MKFSRFKLSEARGFHDAFLLAVVLKGLDGLFQIGLGATLIFTTKVSDIILLLTQDALIEDPDNILATHLHAFASQPHDVFVLGGLYLVAHGLVKGFLCGALWRNYSWAYPATMVFLGAFILYQLIRIAATGSLPLIFLTVFDLLMFWLVWHEYRSAPHRA